MKILHTSDWHVGKVLKGRDRHDEPVTGVQDLHQYGGSSSTAAMAANGSDGRGGLVS